MSNLLVDRRRMMCVSSDYVYGANVSTNSSILNIPFHKYKTIEVCFYSLEHSYSSMLGFASTNSYYNNAGINCDNSNSKATIYFPNPTSGMVRKEVSLTTGNLYSIRYRWPVADRPYCDIYVNGVFQERFYKTGNFSDGIVPSGAFKFRLSKGISVVFWRGYDDDILANNFIVDPKTMKFYDTLSSMSLSCNVRNLTKNYGITANDIEMPYPVLT